MRLYANELNVVTVNDFLGLTIGINQRPMTHKRTTRLSSTKPPPLSPKPNLPSKKTKKSPPTPTQQEISSQGTILTTMSDGQQKTPPATTNEIKEIVNPSSNSPVKPPDLETILQRLTEQDERIQQLESINSTQEAQLRLMSSRVKALENHQYRMDGLMAIKDRVTELLSIRVNQLEQYTRRYSLIVKGLERPRDETAEQLREKVNEILQQSDTVVNMDDVDKFHRNGPIKDNQQEVIVRFKSHSAKEIVYRKRKSLRNVKIQPSLTPENKVLLEQAREELPALRYDSNKNLPEFVYADVHGDLRVKMSVPSKGNFMFHKFTSIQHLYEVVQKCNSGNHKFEAERGDPDPELPSFQS